MGFVHRCFSPKGHFNSCASLCSFSCPTAGQSQETLNHCPISFIVALSGTGEKGLCQFKLCILSDKIDTYIFLCKDIREPQKHLLLQNALPAGPFHGVTSSFKEPQADALLP